jgi:hypothetical protein
VNGWRNTGKQTKQIHRRFEQLENQIEVLRRQVSQSAQAHNPWQNAQDSSSVNMQQESRNPALPSASTLNWAESSAMADADHRTTDIGVGCKRKWHDFEMNQPDSSDLVSRGLITPSDAQAWFTK